MKRHLLVALVVAVLALAGLAVFSGCSAPGTDTSTEAKAAIIDLEDCITLSQNPALIQAANEMLQELR